MARRRSRLNKRLTQQSQKNLILSVGGIIILMLFLVNFGIPFIADLGFFASSINPKNEAPVKKNEDKYIPPPTLDPTFSATNSASVKVEGLAIGAKDVGIFLNGGLFKKITPDSDSKFEVSLVLSEGENIVKAKSYNETQESDFSDSETINYKKSSPDISIETPTEGQSFSGNPQIQVVGKTDSSNRVTINGFRSIVDGQGRFNQSITLKDGDNQIQIESVDSAGNKSEKSIKVSYSP